MKSILVIAFITTLLVIPTSSNVFTASLSEHRMDERSELYFVSNERTLYVGGTGPDNYTKIQDAIDAANAGDTIFVYDDASPYYENLVIDKSIKLIGENKETTIVDGRKKGYVIQIKAENVTLSNFKIRNGGLGGFPEKGGIGIFSDNAKILNNIITNNGFYGMQIYSDNNLIEGNKIYSHAWWSLFFDKSSKNIIRNNTMRSSKGGLYLMSLCNNNLIGNNVMRGIEHAINVYDSNENNVIRNKIFDVSDGIIVSSVFSNAVNNYIAYNNISNCCRCGIIVEASHNIIERNFLSNCGYCSPGFYGGLVIYSPDNAIANNTFLKSGIIVYSFPNKIVDNSINGKPLIYVEDDEGMKIEKEAGQIIVVNSSHIEISNISMNYTNIGVQLLNCNYCIIRNSNLSNNGIGIKCNGSYNLFINNVLRKNADYGIWCDGSFNHIEENKIILNEFIGIYAADNNVIRKNYIAHNLYDGLEISDENIVENNTISFNGLSGILLSYSCNNLIKHNEFMNNYEGISIENGCKNNVIANNEFINDGLWIHWWIIENIGHNEIYDNTINGKPLIYMEEKSNEIVKEAGQVILIKCENISVKNQNILDAPIGIFLWKSKNCNISNNKISLCEVGICISYSTENSIWNNNISCNWKGISFYGSSNNIVSRNFIESNFTGIGIQSSDKNIFTYNFISRTEWGMLAEDSKHNKFYKNTFRNNGETTILITSNFNKFIENNFINNKKDVELYSFYNLWFHNYWDKWHIPVPKPIMGHLGRMPRIPWLNFDLMPRLFPWRQK